MSYDYSTKMYLFQKVLSNPLRDELGWEDLVFACVVKLKNRGGFYNC